LTPVSDWLNALARGYGPGKEVLVFGISVDESLVLVPVLLAIGLITTARFSSLITRSERIRLLFLTVFFPVLGPILCLTFLALRRRRAAEEMTGRRD
jgi:hypothetical protein